MTCSVSNVVSISTDRRQLRVPHPFPEQLRKVDHVNIPSRIFKLTFCTVVIHFEVLIFQFPFCQAKVPRQNVRFNVREFLGQQGCMWWCREGLLWEIVGVQGNYLLHSTFHPSIPSTTISSLPNPILRFPPNLHISYLTPYVWFSMLSSPKLALVSL